VPCSNGTALRENSFSRSTPPGQEGLPNHRPRTRFALNAGHPPTDRLSEIRRCGGELRGELRRVARKHGWARIEKKEKPGSPTREQLADSDPANQGSGDAAITGNAGDPQDSAQIPTVVTSPCFEKASAFQRRIRRRRRQPKHSKPAAPNSRRSRDGRQAPRNRHGKAPRERKRSPSRAQVAVSRNTEPSEGLQGRT